jgi:hypothetical protein
MKPLIRFAVCCLFAPGLFAQSFAQGHGGGAGGGGHFGGTIPAQRTGSIRTFGYGRYGGYGYGLYGYGGLWGDYEPFYDYGSYPSEAAGGANVTVIYSPPAPSVMAAETAHPVIHEYNRPEDYGIPSEREGHPILYLIAFRDSNIRAAMTYWVDGGTLHYLDTDHREKQAPLSSVDRDLSAQLNRERHVPFDIQ